MGGGSVIPQPVMPEGPREVPGSGHGAAWAVGTPPQPPPCERGAPGRASSLPAPRGWMSLQPVGVMPVPGGCPPGGSPSQWIPTPVGPRPGGMPIPGVPVLGRCPSLRDAGPGGTPIPGGVPVLGRAHPGGCPSQGGAHISGAPAGSRAVPHLCPGLSPAADRPHAQTWGCVWGQWPVLTPPPALAPVTSVPSPAPLLPRSRGEPSAPAGSGDGRCSFPVCRLVPPVAASTARPRRHQLGRPGEFQRRRSRSPGAMVMGAGLAMVMGAGMAAPRQGWRRAQREEERGLRGGEAGGEGRAEEGSGRTDGQTAGGTEGHGMGR